MKKVFFISLLLGFALVSCNSDPEENIGEQPNQPDQTEESVKNDDQKEDLHSVWHKPPCRVTQVKFFLLSAYPMW